MMTNNERYVMFKLFVVIMLVLIYWDLTKPSNYL